MAAGWPTGRRGCNWGRVRSTRSKWILAIFCVKNPSGRARWKDRRGNAQFIGEDRIEHTPKHETVTLKLGESFDVRVRRKQTEFNKLSGTGPYNYAYEACL